VDHFAQPDGNIRNCLHSLPQFRFSDKVEGIFMNLARVETLHFVRRSAAIAFLVALSLSALPLFAQAGKTAAPAPPGCASCHDDLQKKLAASAHTDLSCDTCHEGHEKYPHPAGIPKPQCGACHDTQAAAFDTSVHGQAAKSGGAAPDCAVCHGGAHELLRPASQQFRTGVPDTCGMCHDTVVKEFRASVHGAALARGLNEAPVCTDCHGEHNILKHTNIASPVNAANIRETCGSCHADVRLSRKFGLPGDRVLSFDASFHGLAAKAGSQTVANCASCHGVHNILPSSDPNSTVAPKNLPATCGHCHPGAGERFTIGPVHVVEGTASEPAYARMARQFYLIIIPITIGLMILHHGGDWLRKLVHLRKKNGPPYGLYRGRDTRMLPFERIQHAVMAISFIILVITGFALKYPDQFWAKPWLLGGGDMRSLVHRIAGVVLMVVSLVHVVSLIVSRRLRRHWQELIPRGSDVGQAARHFAYNVGLTNRKPYRSPHSYIEKAEYWAVVWGTAVMALTGLMLWANNIALRFLPKSWLDVATTVHFYEAVLATLAIVVWHFYSVIFDPEVYPLDTAFLTGTSVRVHEHAEEPAEVERTE
jgi:cytochrome b subunit of formate dehydrogenase